MATGESPKNPNPNPKGSSSYQIGGVAVEFPYKPYGTQLAFMGRVISTLDRAKRSGRGAHALLESPTGTGKTLSLICSALAWQRSYASRHAAPAEPPLDPLLHGGGFLPEDPPEPPSNPQRKGGNPNSMRTKRKMIRPTIYYASRTHAQISQVIREYRKTSYRVPMAILASRKHYCTNKDVCNSETVDEDCKLLLREEMVGCQEYKNMTKVKAHPFVQKGGCYEAHDIEDLVKVGRMVKGCPYFAAQCMAAEADLVFCPYSYVINPVIRRAMDIDIKDAILILDEAHNIEDMAREAGSVDIEEDVLFALQNELEKLSSIESVAMIYQPLHEMIQGIISWISQRKDNLERQEFEHYCTCWTGDKALLELQKANINQLCFPILKECATKAIRASSDVESDGICLSGMSSLILEELFSSLTFLLYENGRHSLDYQLALQRHVKRDARDVNTGWTHTFSLWCLNPAIIFREITSITLSVILSSGTLSPMGSFASELGVQFEACLEAPHVIDVESQLFAAVVASGPGSCRLNASYQACDGYAFQDALGNALEEIFKIVPGGVLVFFPSYKLLEKLRSRWCHTGHWSRLNDQKFLFVEPRSKTGDFETILKDYYACVQENKTPGRIRRGQKRISGNEAVQSVAFSNKKGAVLFAVCRGKVSEGIDFSNENARAVVIVGIPFPNKTDIQVRLKKKYNDTYKSTKSLLSGSEWYCHQAFRALNQAAGRCIRHKSDFGAVILMDERFMEDRNLVYISRWIKKSIKRFDNFDASLDGLRNFFLKKAHIDQSILNASPISGDYKNYLPHPQHVTLKNCKEERIRKKGKQVPGEQVKKKLSDKDGKIIGGLTVSGRINGSINSVTCNGDNFEESFPTGVVKPKSYSRLSEKCLSDVTFHLDNAEDNASGHAFLLSPLFRNSDEAAFEGLSSSTVITPERNIEEISHTHTPVHGLLSSSNSCNVKRKKLAVSQMAGLAQRYSMNDPAAESCCQGDHMSEHKMSTSIHGKNGITDIISENKYMELEKDATMCNRYIFCMTCKSNLGSGDANLVPCIMTSSSKAYLSNLKHNNSSEQSLEPNSCIDQPNEPVVVCDVSCLNELIFLCKSSRESSKDFWSEADGCVFRTIRCPSCSTGTCLGLRIMAADALNTNLINKVLFYADKVLLTDEDPKRNASLHAYQILNPTKTIISIEDFTYSPTSKSSGLTKSKLRLPKRDLCSPKSNTRVL